MSKYLVSLPQSQRSKYLENENVDFLMDFEGYSLKPNSVKLTGTLIVSKDVTTISAVGKNDDILMDGVAGIDACFQSFTTSVGNTVVENNPEYPRFQKMNLTASQSKAQLVANTENVSALRMYSSVMGKNIIEGITNPGEVPFCFKPNIGLNNSQGLSGSSQVRLSTRLASTRDVVYGGDVDASTSYWLKDLRVEYEVMPMPAGKSQQGFMVVNHCLKQVINNGNANLSMVVPVPSSKISCSMIETDHLNSTSYNHLALEKPDNVTRVELHINDGSSQVVSYPLETEQEILAEYLRSLGLHKHNTIRVKDLIGKHKFGFGYSYTTMMKGAKIGLQIESDLNTPYAIYSYFSSVLEL